MHGNLYVENDYSYTEDNFDESWYPANVEELCLHSGGTAPAKNSFRLWYKIDANMFPKLKRLKIISVLDMNSKHSLASKTNAELTRNLNGLIENGLSSFELKLTDFGLNNIFPGYTKNSDINNNQLLMEDFMSMVQRIVCLDGTNNDGLDSNCKNFNFVRLVYTQLIFSPSEKN